MVSKELYEAYDQAVDALADTASKQAANVIMRYRELVGQMALDELIEAVLQALVDIKNAYLPTSAEVAAEFYVGQREIRYPGMAKDYRAKMADIIPDTWVRHDFEEVRDLPDAPTRMGAKMALKTQQAAERQIRYMSATDSVKSKWAFVPSPGACAWCKLIGSRGWMYNSAKTAEANRHANCTCKVVVDFDWDNPSIDGYNPASLYSEYAVAEETVRAEYKDEFVGLKGKALNSALMKKTVWQIDKNAGRAHVARSE